MNIEKLAMVLKRNTSKERVCRAHTIDDSKIKVVNSP